MDQTRWIANAVLAVSLLTGCVPATDVDDMDVDRSSISIEAFDAFSFYEGNGGSQDLLCTVSDDPGQAYNLKASAAPCDNDEARSVVINFARAGAVLRVFDSPQGRTNDDFATITVKRGDLAGYVISSFEHSFEDDSVRVVYVRDNGLDGKISRITVD